MVWLYSSIIIPFDKPRSHSLSYVYSGDMKDKLKINLDFDEIFMSYILIKF